MNCWVYATAEHTSELHAGDGVLSALTDDTNTALAVCMLPVSKTFIVKVIKSLLVH